MKNAFSVDSENAFYVGTTVAYIEEKKCEKTPIRLLLVFNFFFNYDGIFRTDMVILD